MKTNKHSLINKQSSLTELPKVDLAVMASATVDNLFTSFKTTITGLSINEAKLRVAAFGLNEIARTHRRHWLKVLWTNIKDPLSALLAILGIISYISGDIKETVLVLIMMVLSVGLRFVQEIKADKAAERLKAMVRTTATVMRDGVKKEIPLSQVVVGDVVHLGAGDIVPADMRIIESRDLYVNEAALTGESMPVEKHAQSLLPQDKEVNNLCFLGTSVESGTAQAVVFATGAYTRFGDLAKDITDDRQSTSFDKGVGRFTWLMIRFIFVMVPAVFIINGVSKGDWLQAFFYALAVAVGLTPELLPMIVTVNLSKGALDMSKQKVVVKRLSSIQNLGAMDVLCTDKTGTLTQGRVTLIKHIDILGHDSMQVLDYGYLNSYYQTGLENLLDAAVKKSPEVDKEKVRAYQKIDEIPFDFVRRRMSVVVQDDKNNHILICKGAPEEVMAQCRQVSLQGKIETIDQWHHSSKEDIAKNLSTQGFRLIAIAYKIIPADKKTYKVDDEKDLILLGFLAFLDPAKDTAGQALNELEQYGVKVKILTGDNELVTRKICEDVKFEIEGLLLGSEVQRMSHEQLAVAAQNINIFCKLEPHHKERIIKALQSQGHVVGYLGDGINDAPALKAADVGVSVDSAVDIAKESSDIILLEKSLLVLKAGVREGRKIFSNIVKYIRMTASSNFGNMFSVVGGSIFLPFLPMLPLQVITNNLMYDFSQVTIPSDKVDEEFLMKPRQWKISQMKNYILAIGPISSLFDYATFFIMLYVFNAWANAPLFHTGWFVESLITQTLVIHFIRTNKIPFLQSRASIPLLISSLLVVTIGMWLPYSAFAASLGFVALPVMFWPILLAMLFTYFILVTIANRWFMKRFGED